MPNATHRFEEQKEILYRDKFSNLRYKIFLKIERFYKKFINDEDPRLEIILKNIKNNKPKRILEIGSGTFPIYAFLPKLLKETSEYYICEINPEKVEYIKKNYKNIKTSCGDALNLPYQNQFFDFVFSKGVLHHIDDKETNKREQKRIDFLNETKRVLKDNGSNLLMDFSYNPKRIRDVFWHNLHKLILIEGEHNFSNKTQIKKLFNFTKYKNVLTEEFDTFKGAYYCIVGRK
jgi:SAM-dependent methyltransferase